VTFKARSARQANGQHFLPGNASANNRASCHPGARHRSEMHFACSGWTAALKAWASKGAEVSVALGSEWRKLQRECPATLIPDASLSWHFSSVRSRGQHA